MHDFVYDYGADPFAICYLKLSVIVILSVFES